MLLWLWYFLLRHGALARRDLSRSCARLFFRLSLCRRFTPRAQFGLFNVEVKEMEIYGPTINGMRGRDLWDLNCNRRGMRLLKMVLTKKKMGKSGKAFFILLLCVFSRNKKGF